MVESAAMSRRERTRAATIAEIKGIALRQMHESGTTDVRFSDIAREMGMSAPGLYRYFASREALLTELMVDAYNDLAAAIVEAREVQPLEDLGGRVFAVCRAYRDWARRQPERFALVFGTPVPGYEQTDGRVSGEAGKRAIGALTAIFLDAKRLGALRPPLVEDCDPSFALGINAAHSDDQLMAGAWADDQRKPVAKALTPLQMQTALNFWASLHGFTSLDANGHLDWLGADAKEALFVSSVQQAARSAGLPEPSQAT